MAISADVSGLVASRSAPRGNIPKNAVTKRPYSGGNVIFLWAHGYATQRWLTFKQTLDVGGAVGKGEHGVKVYFVSKVEKTTDTDEVRHVPFLKEYTVFNVAQCHGLPEECLTGEVTVLNPHTPDEAIICSVDAAIQLT